jgi:hypothetical protein
MGKTTFELNQPKAASFIDRLFIADENQKRRGTFMKLVSKN